MQRHALISAAALTAGAAALVAAGFAIWRRFFAGTFLRFDTMFGKTRVYQVSDDAGRSVRLLEVGGIVQSGTYVDDGYTELVFEYLKRYDTMFEAERSIERVCVLGCGGYDYPEHLIAHHPEVMVDAVEIDPAITAIARRYFFLDRLIEEYKTEETGRLNLICADALDHLQQPGPSYDAIVNDVFDAGSPPSHLTTEEFIRAVHARLRPDGLYLTNIVSPLEGPEARFLHEQVALLESVFDRVDIIPCAADEFAEADNVIVMARA
ncbi:MAG: fused MFS/spermidine synthase [Eggerthellaceae bacterium]|nr:fused MFS/spermidine synthase [Eggerthellaceae bacterium]